MIESGREVLTNLAHVEAGYPIIFWVCLAAIIVCTVAWGLNTLDELGLGTGGDLAVSWVFAETVVVIGTPIIIATKYGSTLATLVTLVVIVVGLLLLRVVANVILGGIDSIRRRLRRS